MVMNYRQLNAGERSALAALRRLGVSQAEIARQLGPAPEHDRSGAAAQRRPV